MVEFRMIESNSYCHGDKIGIRYLAETVEEARAIIKSKMNPWIDYFVTFDNTTYPAYVWLTTNKLEEHFKHMTTLKEDMYKAAQAAFDEILSEDPKNEYGARVAYQREIDWWLENVTFDDE